MAKGNDMLRSLTKVPYNNMRKSFFSSSSNGIMVSASGAIGTSVAAAHQRFPDRRPAAQPLGIELADIALSQRAIFAIARPLCLGESRIIGRNMHS
jgi:hypothetical protein